MTALAYVTNVDETAIGHPERLRTPETPLTAGAAITEPARTMAPVSGIIMIRPATPNGVENKAAARTVPEAAIASP